MATPGKHSAAEGSSISALSNDELGELWVQTLRSYAARRTGSSRRFWAKLFECEDVNEVLDEFKRRVHEREEEYAAWLQLAEWPSPYSV